MIKTNITENIAFCGLNCDECFAFKLDVSESAKKLRRELNAYKIKAYWKYLPMLGEYESFKKTLDGLAMLRCTKQCRGGGGNPWCKIRKCVMKKKLNGCWECTTIEGCTKLSDRDFVNIDKIKKQLSKPKKQK